MAEAQELSESIRALSHEESSNVENDHDDQDFNSSSGTSKKSKKILQEEFGSLRPFGTDDESKEYRCSSCYRLAIDHCYSNCKHLFCVKCYLRNFQHPCPVCDTILETNTLDQDFEKRLLDLPIECKFKKYGCEDLVKLKDFENHINRCKFSTKKLLPKVYKSNPIAEAIERLTDDVRRLKEDDVQSIKEALTKFNEAMTTLTENVEVQDTKMKKMAEEEHLRKGQIGAMKTILAKCNEKIRTIDEANKEMKTEITKLNDTVKTIDEGGKKLLESNRDIKDLHAVIFKKWIEDEMRMTRLKEAMEEAETLRKLEIIRLETRIQESESQMDKTKTEHQSEITRLETRIQESESQMDKTKTEHQSEIQSLKTEHKNRIEELRAVESQQDRHLERLEERVTELQYHHKDDGGNIIPDIFIWKIPKITKIMQDLVKWRLNAYRSKNYFTNQNGERFKLVIYMAKQNKCVNIHLEFSAANSSEPYLRSRRFFLIDQSTSMRKNNVEMIDRPKCKRNSANDMMATFLSTTQFFPPRLLQGKNNYVNNDAILIKIIFEPVAFLWRQIEAQNGVCLWRINDYSKKKRLAIDGVKLWLTSKPFKTSRVGYTAQLRLYLNGEGSGEGEYISIFIRFLLGEHDESLPLPFNCKFTFCLIDQTDSPTNENISMDYTHEFNEGDFNRGIPQFVLQNNVESSKFLRNDSIVIKTNVIML